MIDYEVVGGLQVATDLRALLRPLIEIHTSSTEEAIWSGFAMILSDLQPKTTALLDQQIGELAPRRSGLEITPQTVDPEIARSVGPQLVVPISNPRLALDALNARWGSLFDALDGADATAGQPSDQQRVEYGPDHGQRVIDFVASFLDRSIPLSTASHGAVIRYFIDRGQSSGRLSLKADLDDEQQIELADPAQFRGFLGHMDSPTTLLFEHDGLHVEIQVNPGHAVGRQTGAGVRDVLLEVAPTVVQDLGDSVAVEYKLAAYRHWAGLIDGSLEIEVEQDGRTVFRRPRQDRYYLGTDGDSLVLKGRSLMLIRTGGLRTSCVRDLTGGDVYEGILDTFVATVCALPDLRQDGSLTNSAFGRIYLVKPRLNPPEATFTRELTERVERLLGLEPDTIDLRVMDENAPSQRTRLSERAAATAAVRFFTPSFE